MLDKIILPREVEAALEDGAALSISVSGGKDSDATAMLLTALHRERGYSGPIELCHCDMGRSEWSFTREYVRNRAADLGVPITIVRNPERDLQDLFAQRSVTRPDVPLWPSALHRYCTSAKVAEIDRHLRQWVGKSGTVVSAVGVRAAESKARARKPVYCVRKHVETSTRKAFTWSPIHHLSTEETWELLGVSQGELLRVRQAVREIRKAGGTVWRAMAEVGWKFHLAYALGSERLSCSLCILASKGDLLVGIEHNRQYYSDLVDMEIRTGWAFQNGRYLAELRPDLLTEQQRRAFAEMRARKAKGNGQTQPALF